MSRHIADCGGPTRCAICAGRMNKPKSRTITKHWATFEEYPCLCGSKGCDVSLAVVRGVPKGTISLGIREHDSTIKQAYLDIEQARMLATQLIEMTNKISGQVDAAGEQAADEDIAAGRVQRFDDVDEAIAWLRDERVMEERQ